MPRPITLDLQYEILTPVYMSGADQTTPELRAPSIRGAVRAWYRAIDPAFRHHEVRWFGAADQPDGTRDKVTQKSPWQLRVLTCPKDTFSLDRNAYRRYDVGQVPNLTNGVLWTGFSLLDRFNVRRAIDASSRSTRRTFDLRLVITQPEVLGSAGLAGVLGAFWLLGHLGGLGSRGRRGWGSVQLRHIRAPMGARVAPEVEAVLAQLAPARTKDLRTWLGDVERVVGWLRGQLPGERDEAAAQCLHLGKDAWVSLLKRGHPEWAPALREVGAAFQAFRREQHADRRMLVDDLLTRQRQPRPGTPLKAAVRRVALGLPLTFRIAITPKRVKDLGISQLAPDVVEFSPNERAGRADDPQAPELTRFPGPVTLRVVRLDDGWHGLVLRQRGAPVGTPDPWQGGVAAVKATIRNNKQKVGTVDRLPTQGEAIVDELRAWLKQDAAEVML